MISPADGVAKDQDDELVAPESSHHAVGAHRTQQSLRGGAQQIVTGRVTQRVVGRLEVVDVDEQHRAQTLGGVGLKRPVELSQYRRPVGQIGERVVPA